MTINYRIMTAQDIPDIFSVDRMCFEHNWTLESYECELNNMLATYIVAEDNDQIIGFGGFWAIIDEAQITNIGVLESYRGRGVAQKILNEMIKLAGVKGCLAMTLEVRVDNKAAIALYEANGFEKAGVRKNYYDNKTDGLIMWRYQLE
ncbi:ribosomal protein S18-alanine N-acetyltransferase [Acetobacterium bakii]|uniref:[Ribosomal protein bS18]-alanine N-acetyltransferase n=1 Tax=Acetobacterium bakii TaxID=52689 RepID=A0A0L6TY95_9FIRM|nr:ribosomal protein S18-alanine N-acetyltransferase [Acetobacterium bakii]KNZ40535.1 hypothetical protein AKG39_17155 [Acetobacterium bakii]